MMRFSVRGSAPALILLSLLGAAPRGEPIPATSPAVSWQFVVTLADPARGLVDVTMRLQGQRGDVRLCLFMDDAERYVRGLKRQSPGPAIKQDDECWRLLAAQPEGTTLSYQYDLRALADAKGQPDYAQRLQDTYLWNDQAVLLHPAPLPLPAAGAPPVFIEVEFHLPSGLPLVTPWTRVSALNAAPRFRFATHQHDGGSYIGMGTLLRDLGTLPFGKGRARLSILDLPHRASAETLRTWLGAGLAAVKAFYGELISADALLVLVPVAGSSDPALFGTVLRQGTPSIVLYFGADCPAPTLASDWTAIHEMFHTGNPLLDKKLPWLVEGFTTYYEDVLRVRAGALTPEQAFGDLYDGFRRFCQPQDGVALAEESQQLRSTHRYNRVYWGGACLAFIADAAIRERSHGQRSLDAVLLELRRLSLDKPLREAEVLKALDDEAGGRLVTRLLHEQRSIDLAAFYRRLGIEPTGPKSVRLVDTAPLSAIRQAIMRAAPQNRQ